MKKEIDIEKLEERLKAFDDSELSLDELDGVSGGWSYTDDGGDTMTIDLTEDEYTFLNTVLGLSIAKSIIDQYGLGGIQIERHMVVPRDKGETLKNLLSAFMGSPT